MALYYFDVDTDDGRFRDESGTECPDDQSARDHSQMILMETARDYIPSDVPQKNVVLWVRNENGSPVFQLSLTFAARPVSPRT
jgi:hypothetical protein